MENINELYGRLIAENKNKLIEVISQEYGISRSSVRTNWFSSGKIPTYARVRVVELLVNMLKIQNKKTDQMIGK